MLTKYRHSTFIFLSVGIFFTGVIYLEWQKTIHEYYAHSIQDFKFRYENKLDTYTKISEISLHMIEMHTPTILEQITVSQPSQDFLALQILLRKEGITNFQIYSPRGDVLLNSQAIPTADHTSLSHNTLLQQALETKKATVGLLFTSTFQGFRYVRPLMHDHQLLGYAQISISTNDMIAYLDKNTQNTSCFLYQKTFFERTEDSNEWTRQFTPLDTNEHYYIHKELLKNAMPTTLKVLSSQLTHNAIPSDGVAFSLFVSLFKSELVVMLPIENYHQARVGILVSIQHDSKYLVIALFQILKMIVLWITLGLLYYFYRNNQQIESLLQQYKEAVDISALVSKTDISGRITYVNEPFVKISGYSAHELLGHNHRIIRSPEMSHHFFKEMWKTVKSGKVWKGRITNKKKNGERYTVNSTIIPITNENGKILEYIALRYDITELEAYREILETKLNDTDVNLHIYLDMIRQYQNAIEQASAFCRFDPNGTIVYVNETMCSVAKLEQKEMLGQSVITLGLFYQRRRLHSFLQPLKKVKCGMVSLSAIINISVAF